MKNFKRIIAMTVVAVMVMALVPFSVSAASAWSGGAASSFESGTGTEADPYIIADGNQLAYLATLASGTDDSCKGKYYKLANDIDLNNKAWTPIGSSVGFNGIFDGDGYTIIGLNVEVTDKNAGLFGTVTGGTIKNLNVEGKLVSGKKYVGGVVGYASQSSHIINCHSKIDLVAAKAAEAAATVGLGGVVGRIEKATGDDAFNLVLNCSSESNVGEVTDVVYKTAFIGGVVGVAGSTNIINCSNTGNVIASTATSTCLAGGIVACMGASDAETNIILNSSSGNITAYQTPEKAAYAGGIVGRIGHVTGGVVVGNFSTAEAVTYEVGTTTPVEGMYGGVYGQTVSGKNSSVIYNYSTQDVLYGVDNMALMESATIKTTVEVLEGTDVFTELKIPDTILKAATAIVRASVHAMTDLEEEDLAKLAVALGGKDACEYIAEQMLAEKSVDGSLVLVETSVIGGMPVCASEDNSIALANLTYTLSWDSCDKVEALAKEKLGSGETDTTQTPGNETTQTPGDETTQKPDDKETQKPDDATTKAPDQTKEPDQTEAPAKDKGCKSVVISGIAVVVMAAAAVVALKKKD